MTASSNQSRQATEEAGGGRCAVRSVRVVANPAAGQDRAVLASLNAVFTAAGVDWDVSVTKGSGDAESIARSFVEEGVDVVAAYGGDGTIAEVTAALIGTGVPLGILPGGTGNVFAWELGLPMGLEDAARVVCAGVVREVDVGSCDGQRFVLRVGVGYEAEAGLAATRELKDRLGRMAYVLTGLKELGYTEVSRFSLDLDGAHEEAEGFTCVVANAGSLGLPNLRLSPEVRVDDGLLDVFVVPDPSIESVATLVGRLVAGNDPEVFHRQARRVRVDSDPPRPVTRDGEPQAGTPVEVELLPRALRVLVVPGSDGG